MKRILLALAMVFGLLAAPSPTQAEDASFSWSSCNQSSGLGYRVCVDMYDTSTGGPTLHLYNQYGHSWTVASKYDCALQLNAKLYYPGEFIPYGAPTATSLANGNKPSNPQIAVTTASFPGLCRIQTSSTWANWIYQASQLSSFEFVVTT